MKMPPVTAMTMSEIDERARTEYGISQELLMENAGKSVAEVILNDHPAINKEHIVIFCGKGNNGGDGFVIARCLAGKGAKNLVVFVSDPENIKEGAALNNYRKIKEQGLDLRHLHDYEIASHEASRLTILVDAFFGTGFTGELPDDIAIIWDLYNVFQVRRYAVDVPSGLDATTGKASGSCFNAHKTVTFGFPKAGFFINDGPTVCGEVQVRDIGFPPELLKQYIDP